MQVELLRQDIDLLRQDVELLRQDVEPLRQDVELLRQDVDLLRQDVELLRQDIVNILIEHAGHAQGDPLARRRQERTLPGWSLDDNALKMSLHGEALFHEQILSKNNKCG